MSDSFVKIIPVNHDYLISNDIVNDVLEYLKTNVKSDSINAYIYDHPAFIDCGSNLDKIQCPLCNKNISFDWWGISMDKAYENEFNNLVIQLPCCGNKSSLKDLIYHFPCGFACFEFVLLNPKTELSVNIIKVLEKLLKMPIRIIRSHI